jgi:pimeloyl-ACP methyl ester carboxylesterase
MSGGRSVMIPLNSPGGEGVPAGVAYLVVTDLLYSYLPNMRRFLIGFLLLLAVLGAVYALGPRPAPPATAFPTPALPTSLPALEAQIQATERAEPGLRPGCEARIVWADSGQRTKTPYAFLYLHGFSASPAGEADPVIFNLARTFGANLYLARMAGHGVDLGDSTMRDLTTDAYLASAERGLAIARRLGDTVVVVGTSAGGALTLWLAARHPDIRAAVTYSPCIEIFDPKAQLLDDPWGLHLARLITGKAHNDITTPNEGQRRYWTTHYRLEGVRMLQNFLTHEMTEPTFRRVTCPVLLCYYYKNDQEQDRVVSVPAMRRMFDQLGTPDSLKRQVNLPSTARHEMASKYLSRDWPAVERTTVQFLRDVVGVPLAASRPVSVYP